MLSQIRSVKIQKFLLLVRPHPVPCTQSKFCSCLADFLASALFLLIINHLGYYLFLIIPSAINHE